MSKVKRYENDYGAIMGSDDGEWVNYKDYAALEQKLTDMAVQLANAESKCRELAAELSAVDKIHNEAVFITDDHYEQCPPEVQKMIRSLAVLQIPAYYAFLAEVRASVIDDAKGMFKNSSVMVYSESVVEELSKFAAKLRKGASE